MATPSHQLSSKRVKKFNIQREKGRGRESPREGHCREGRREGRKEGTKKRREGGREREREIIS
tara:strand:- start:214 stop:402 length:189 start_codon:yes stop_codon:yes gene_type:complete